MAAALWLGRYRRKTLLLDAGNQRNLAAKQSHGYLGSDGVSPRRLIDDALADLKRYDTVEHRKETADGVRADGNSFIVTVGSAEHRTQRIVLATGVNDTFPNLPGFEELYGTSIFHCPCCDGFEACDQDVLVIGWGEHVAGYALDLLDWGARVTVVTGGRSFQGDDVHALALARHDVDVIQEAVTEMKVFDGQMTGAVVASGRTLPATMAFFSIAHQPRTDLATALGCSIDDDGYITVDTHGQTNIEGVYAAGDVTPGEQLVQVAAAKGAIAGIACAMSLRGGASATGAPEPGPDPRSEIG
jgi:thioredoxin reductase